MPNGKLNCESFWQAKDSNIIRRCDTGFGVWDLPQEVTTKAKFGPSRQNWNFLWTIFGPFRHFWRYFYEKCHKTSALKSAYLRHLVQNIDFLGTILGPVDQSCINIKEMYNHLHETVDASGHPRPPYPESFLFQERQTDGSYTWFSHCFEFNITIFSSNYTIRDLDAKLELSWDHFWPLVLFGTKFQIQDLIAAPV